MKIIITGSTGSLGAYLTRYFAAAGHHVIACGRAAVPPAALTACAEYLQADITAPFELPDADVCIHTAARSDDKGEWEDFQMANVVGTRHVLRAAAQCGTFIHISTSAVYLPQDKLISEDIAGQQAGQALSFYGASKLASEKVVQEQASQRQCFILRPRALYGQGDKKILPRMLRLVHGRHLYRPGHLRVNVSMTHYQNLAEAICACLQSGLTGVRTYNVSDRRPYVLLDVVRAIVNGVYGRPLPERHIPAFLLKGLGYLHIGGMTPLLVRALTQDMVLDTRLIERELQFRPSRSFEEALPGIADWALKVGGPGRVKEGSAALAWEV